MILAVDANGIPCSWRASGFHPVGHEEALNHLQNAGIWLGPRNVLEERETFRQIIPYIVLRHDERIVSYVRTMAGGERRLHGRMSVGVGGHVDLSDVSTIGESVDLRRTLDKAAHREVDEELGGVKVVSQSWIGVIVDNETPVGRVHIGLVGLWSIGEQPYGTVENAIGHVRMDTLKELNKEKERMEAWSSMVLPYLEDGE